MVLLYLEEQIIEDEEFRLLYEDYRKVMESYYFWTADKDMKVNKIFFNLSGWKRTWKNSGLTGNRTLTFVMTGRNALSIDLIHPTRGQTRIRFPVKPEFFQVLFQPLRLFILMPRACSLSYSLIFCSF